MVSQLLAVTTQVTLRPAGSATVTSLFTGPSWIAATSPHSWLRALSLMPRSVLSITEDDLTRANTSLPMASARLSALALVMIAAISVRASRRMRTS
ncbi:hypothetical protein D3C78_996120 [compost metagenome]